MRKRCLVFGGSGAIGSKVCSTLVEMNAAVTFTYFSNESFAMDLQSHLPNSQGYFCDFFKTETIKAAVDSAVIHMGGLDTLIFTTGSKGDSLFIKGNPEMENFESFANITHKSLQEMIQINCVGSFWACQEALPYLLKQGGNIIFVGSLDGVKPLPSPIHFATARGGVKGLVESLSKELGRKNIKVNQIALGLLEEGSSKNLSIAMKKNYIKYCALERLGKVSEAANLISWMATENTYITGQSIILDGGL